MPDTLTLYKYNRALFYFLSSTKSYWYFLLILCSIQQSRWCPVRSKSHSAHTGGSKIRTSRVDPTSYYLVCVHGMCSGYESYMEKRVETFAGCYYQKVRHRCTGNNWAPKKTNDRTFEGKTRLQIERPGNATSSSCKSWMVKNIFP